jgi:peptidoglycan hydrolase-like protein with peptidoglycan-binding domain
MGTSTHDIPARRWPDIWRFVDGPVVELAQYLLDAQGYTLTPDGDFGLDMNDVVADFQSRNGIPVDPDSKFDAATWEALVPALTKNSTGLAVSGLQSILNHKGYSDVVVNGTFDHPTQKAVQDIQLIHGLIPNGKVDVDTWCAVSGGIVRQAFRV